MAVAAPDEARRSRVRLTPNGGRDAVDGIERLADGRSVLKVRVRAAASEGEANAALLKLIAKTLGVAPRRVELVAGATSRIKRLRIAGDGRDAAPRCWRKPARSGNPGQEAGMTAHIIDGKAIAADLRGKVADAVHRLARDRGIMPGLAVVLVGNNPASESLCRQQDEDDPGSGMRSFDHRLPATTSEAELLALIARLNADPDGARHPGAAAAARADRRTEGASPRSIRPRTSTASTRSMPAGSSAGLPALAPCTPLGCVLLAKTVQPSLAGLEAVVIGRSNIVGKPLAQLLLAENATVTIAHSKTRDLPAVCRRADLLFAAVGRPEMVRRDWVKPGATVIDVGINRVPGEDGKSRLVGDVAFAEVARGRRRDHAGAGRRRTDDHRLPARQHAARGLRPRRLRAPSLGQGPTDDRE